MSDEDAIKDTISAWLAASKEGDRAALADILDDDMLFVVAGRPPFGKNAFLAGSPGKPYRFEARVEVLEVVVEGNWALSRVRLDIEFGLSEGAGVAHLSGPTMTVWRKSATGRWRIWRDANMVAPVA